MLRKYVWNEKNERKEKRGEEGKGRGKGKGKRGKERREETKEDLLVRGQCHPGKQQGQENAGKIWNPSG